MPVVPFIPAIASVVGVGTSIHQGNKAASAAKGAAATSAAAQDRALQYQQSVEELPLGFRDAAMESLGGEYGLTMDQEGNIISDGSSIQDRTMASPFYSAMLDQGESAVGRNASATGRLRGGATPADLGFNAQNAYNQAYQQQVQGLSSFSRTPLNTNSIASSMAGIGATTAQGQIASAQAKQQGIQGAIGAIGQGIQMYAGV